MLVNRRESQQILTGEVNLKLLDADLLGKLAWESIVHSEVLKSYISGILHVVVILERKRAVISVRGVCHLTCEVRLACGVGDHPVGSRVINFHSVLSMNLRQIAIRTVVHSPEESGLAAWIPVTLAYALQEYTDADSVPVGAKIDSEIIARALIADALKVAMVIKSTFAVVNLSVTVDVYEFKVSGIRPEVGPVLVEFIGRPVVGLLIAEEVPVGPESPDLPKFLTPLEVKDVTVEVILLLHQSA